MNQFPLLNTSSRVAGELRSADLGRHAIVRTGNDRNVVIGKLRGFEFDNFQVSPKHGPVFDVNVKVGDYTIRVKQEAEITLGDPIDLD